MIGRFARSAHPSIITIHDVAECKVYRSEDLILPSSSRIGELLTPLLMPPSLYNFFLTKSMSDSRLADGVICVSEFSKYQAIRYLGIDPKKIIVIFSGVDHEVFKPRDKAFCREHFGFPLNIPIVLHVGSEIQRKNIPVLLKSFRRFKENFPDAILVRVGRKRSSTAHIIEKYGLTHSIRYFYGIQTDLARLYNAADLFVFPSSYEGFGLPPLEAMASGCPVIAGNCDAIREVVNSAGILVDPHDEKGLFLAMKELFEDEGLRQELIRKGIDRSKKFSWEMCAKETIRYYEKVLNEKKIYGYS
jgi:glycosyltransferase involved in cell wall biosynthesis